VESHTSNSILSESAWALKSLGVASLCLLLTCQPSPAAVSEYDTKAALILKIGKFVHWPQDAFANSGGMLRLCIVGRDDFGPSADNLAGHRLQGQTITIARLSDPGQSASDCRIIFISASERERLPALLDSIVGDPVLTISDIDGFASRGGMIGFATTASKVRFEINAAASKRAGLAIGAQLLQLATLIDAGVMDAKP
jgi:hypothetical protein